MSSGWVLLIPVAIVVWFVWRAASRRAGIREWERQRTERDMAQNPQNYVRLPDPRDIKNGTFAASPAPETPKVHVWQWSFLKTPLYGQGNPRDGFGLLTYPITTLSDYVIKPVEGHSVPLDEGDGSGLLWRATYRGHGGPTEELGDFDDLDDAEDAVEEHQNATFGGWVTNSIAELSD